jgi:hypothetical protein
VVGWEPLRIHRYRLEEDLLFWRPQGEVQASDAAGVCLLFSGLIARHGYVLWLIDAEMSIPVGFETRRTYVRWIEQAQGPLFVGAFRAQRPAATTAALVVRATRLLHGSQVYNEVFPTESEARVWLSDSRQQWLAQQGRATSPSQA